MTEIGRPLLTVADQSANRELTSRNLPPLTRGSNQPWYLDEDSPARVICAPPGFGIAMTRTRVANNKDSVLSIFRKSKV